MNDFLFLLKGKIYQCPPTILGKAHVLLVGYGDFEGQTLNVGHHWGVFGGGIAWDGYLLKP